MILYQTPQHKHKWVNEGHVHVDTDRYQGTLFVCSCGKKEVDSGLTNRVMSSFFQMTLDDLPPLSFGEDEKETKQS